MKPIPRLADDMRIYLATEKMENQEILETLLESREDSEAALMSARQKVSDVFVSYILPAEKGARSKKLDHDGFLLFFLNLPQNTPKNGVNFAINTKRTESPNIPNALTQ